MPLGEVLQLRVGRVRRARSATDGADGVAGIPSSDPVGRTHVDQAQALTERMMDVRLSGDVRGATAPDSRSHAQHGDRELEALILVVADRTQVREVDI